MEWNQLCAESKSVIEWVENPYTGKRQELEIKVGAYFSPPSPTGIKAKRIFITLAIYKEIVRFVTEDENLVGIQSSGSFMFKIDKNSKLKLH